MDFWAVTARYHQQRISSRDPGRSGWSGGGEKRDTTISIPPTRNSAPCRQRTFVEINFRREMATSKNETIRGQEEERQREMMVKRSIITQSVRILGKRSEGNKWPRCTPESDRLKVLHDFPTWDRNRDKTLQARHCYGFDAPHTRDPRVWRGWVENKTLTSLVLTSAGVRRKRNPTLW